MHRFGRRAPLVTLTLLFLIATSAVAQEKPPITVEDYDKWESLGFGTLSQNGEWMAYSISRVDGKNELRVRDLSTDSTKVVPFGSRPTFSKDGRWLAYTIGYSEDERERMQEQKKPIHNRLGLLAR